MKTEEFDYELPGELIACYPLENRSGSKLLVLNSRDGSIDHKNFFDIPSILKQDDLLVLNNTKVIPARLKGSSKSRNNIEILLVNKLENNLWEVLLKKPRNGLEIKFENGVIGNVIKTPENIWVIRFNKDIESELFQIGKMPLPPYIQRDSEEIDKVRYQTVYARNDGAIAAPTAGLHFTDEIFEQLKKKGIQTEYITLHVGIGTFRPVKSEDIENHKMHSEYFEISESAASSINEAIKSKRRVVAVGTTVVRALESSISDEKLLIPGSGFTDIFITPPYDFKVVKGLITNFHLPKSTLLMLVSAFAGKENILNAYDVAKTTGYRFLSYGDAMFIF